jgi:hypothetical protein
MKKTNLLMFALLVLSASVLFALPVGAADDVGFNVDCTGAYGFGVVPDHTAYEWRVVFFDPQTGLVFTEGGIVGPASFDPVVLWPIPPSEGTSEDDSYYWWDIWVVGQNDPFAHGEGHFNCQPPPPPHLEGCTPGYWKQSQHFDSWTGFAPGDSFEAVFGRDVPGNPTLLDALKLGGGGLKALMRHAVAALLNASSPDVDPDPAFDTTAEVIAAFQAAFDSGDYETTKDLLDASNNAGCPLD